MFGGYLRLISVFRLKMTPKSCCEFIWNTNLSISQMQHWQDYLFLPRRVESSTVGIVVKRFCCGLFSINVVKLEVCFPEPPSLYICKQDFVKRKSHKLWKTKEKQWPALSLKIVVIECDETDAGTLVGFICPCSPLPDLIFFSTDDDTVASGPPLFITASPVHGSGLILQVFIVWSVHWVNAYRWWCHHEDIIPQP